MVFLHMLEHTGAVYYFELIKLLIGNLVHEYENMSLAKAQFLSGNMRYINALVKDSCAPYFVKCLQLFGFSTTRKLNIFLLSHCQVDIQKLMLESSLLEDHDIKN